MRYDESAIEPGLIVEARKRRGLPRHGRRVTSAQIVVTLPGLAAVLWVNWYFFVAGRGRAAAAGVDAGGVQRIARRGEGRLHTGRHPGARRRAGAARLPP